jgi:hypothetical protein
MSKRINKRQHDALQRGHEGYWDDFDLARDRYYIQDHYRRRKKFVKEHCQHLHCMDCGGHGEYCAEVIDFGDADVSNPMGRYEVCGWCDGTGLMTPHERGAWLTMVKEMKRANKPKGERQ